MDNKNGKFKSTEEKFKRNRIRTGIPLSTRMINNFINMRQKNVHKTFRFWFTNFIMICLVSKSLQFLFYIKEFVVSVPREEAMNNMMINDFRNMKQVDTNVLNDYLDKLEEKKNNREKKSNEDGNKKL